MSNDKIKEAREYIEKTVGHPVTDEGLRELAYDLIDKEINKDQSKVELRYEIRSGTLVFRRQKGWYDCEIMVHSFSADKCLASSAENTETDALIVALASAYERGFLPDTTKWDNAHQPGV